MKNVLILGASGSLGSQVFDYLYERRKDYKIRGICGWSNDALLQKQAFKVKCLYTSRKTLLSSYDLLKKTHYDIIVNCVSGLKGIEFTWFSLSQTKNIILGNKESLVIGGKNLLKTAKKMNVQLNPLDSELTSLIALKNYFTNVEKYLITASGGVLKNKKTKLNDIDILNHPNWNMGKQITIDSSTMVNKVYEWVGAINLFKLIPNQIDTLICKDSVIHGGVKIKNEWYVIKAKPSMKDYINLVFTNYDQKMIIKLLNKYEFNELINNKLEPLNISVYPIFKYRKNIFENKRKLITLLIASQIYGKLLIRKLITYDKMINLLLALIK